MQKITQPKQEKDQGTWPVEFAHSVKRLLTYQIEREMARQGLTRVKMAAQMKTSRAALNRLLDPDNRSVTLQTMERAAEVLGKKLQIFLND
ncbi:MAG: Fis family transcriptional regulator [Alphaproteobacteria bacterium]|nr:Fis family transcriptional regulator [Alphaproteobacteria bacterium]